MQTTQGTTAGPQATAPVLAPGAAEADANAAVTQVPAGAPAAGAAAAYEAARAARNELRGQLDALVSQRHSLLRELEDHDVGGQATSGMQARIQQLDARIAELDVAIARADAGVVAAAAVPGAVVQRPDFMREGPPEEVFFMVPPLLAVVFFPIAIAFARRIWKRSGQASVAQLPSDLSERLNRLEAMGETTALEVERIGEGQRFVTRLLTERGNLLGEGERVPAQR